MPSWVEVVAVAGSGVIVLAVLADVLARDGAWATVVCAGFFLGVMGLGWITRRIAR